MSHTCTTPVSPHVATKDGRVGHERMRFTAPWWQIFLHLDNRSVHRRHPALVPLGIRFAVIARVAVVVHLAFFRGGCLVAAPPGLLKPRQTHHREVVLVRDIRLSSRDCEERMRKGFAVVAHLVAHDVEG
jgi:hypothetical protein